MKELKCPKCGHVFQVDEDDYASIVNQVKNAEFQEEVERRIQELHHQNEVEQKALASEAASRHQLEIGKKDTEILQLKAQIKVVENAKDAEKALALSAQEKNIAELQSQLKEKDSQTTMAVMQAEQKAQAELMKKQEEIAQLKAQASAEKAEAMKREKLIEDTYKDKLKASDDLVAYYKDLKTRLSTKMVGETLEIHCSTQFNQMLRPVMPNAYFEKDNDASDGTKGDFIFRDSEDGVEYVSIMFEMKNEMDTTATKHKNEDFFKKLDDDRRKKGCEFAVLVSMLEPESELYNGGIVDVSYRYDKMYVIRPQFFIPLITLLVQTSKKSLDYKKQLVLAQSKEVDVTKFEAKIEDFRASFTRHYKLASDKYENAIKQIDETIAKLQKVRENLVGSENNFRLAQKDTDDLTIRKLTYNNPTMKAKFDEARAAASQSGEAEE